MALARWLENREIQFWTLHLAGWVGFGVAFYIGALPVAREELWVNYHQHVIFLVLAGMGLSLMLRYVYRGIWDEPWPMRTAVSVFAVIVVSMAWIAFRSIYFFWLYPEQKPEQMGWLTYFGGFPYSLSVMLGWSGMYYGMRYYRILKRQTEQFLQASSTAHMAQLKMLRYQLNPHFLFNTLNAISTLVLERDTPRANSMVGKLSEFLRYSLDNDPMQKVTLKTELHALNLYLGIEKVRFQERLQLNIDVAPEAQRGLVPSLILQPLVENAVKYAVAPSEDGGKLSLRALVDGDQLVMVVQDDGPGLIHKVDLTHNGSSSQTSGMGVGLRNTRDRLVQIYGAGHSIDLAQADPSGLRVEIRIPYETGSTG